MPLVRTTPAAARARERGQAAFLDAVEELVGAGARFADLPVADIARRAGFSRASFYAYFSDKRALAVAIGDRFRERLQAQVGGWLRGEGGGDLRQALAGTRETFARHRGALLVLAEASAYDAELASFWRDLHGTFEALVRDRAQRDDPALDPAAADARAFVLTWGTQAVLVEHLAAGRVDEGPLVDALELVWQAALQPRT